MIKFEYPLIIYTDDDARENYFKHQKKEHPTVVILDDNPLSLACYMEDHPEIDFEDSSDLTYEEKEKLNKMLKELEVEGMDAQDIIDSVGRRR